MSLYRVVDLVNSIIQHLTRHRTRVETFQFDRGTTTENFEVCSVVQSSVAIAIWASNRAAWAHQSECNLSILTLVSLMLFTFLMASKRTNTNISQLRTIQI